MQNKALLSSALSAILSLVLNLVFLHSLASSLLNTLTLGLSVYFFQSNLILRKTLFNILYVASLGAIPLIYFEHTNRSITFLPILSLGFCYLYYKFPRRYLIIFLGIFLFFGNLYSSGLIEYPLKIQSSQLIFNSPEINYNIQRHQQDALFIPYRARLLVYSQLIYIYAFLTNLFNFLNLKNLYDILLIANIYPFFTGIYILIKQKSRFKDICLTAFLITALTVGIDRSSENFKSLYLLGPIFIYLILLGSQTINKKIYFFLWILSLFLLISKI